MNKIKDGIVFSYDIEKILNGTNAFDFEYEFVPNDTIIKNLREDFEKDVNKIFNNKVTIIKEDEMMSVNNLIGGEYPHCYIR